MSKYIYEFYSITNYAETWRDADQYNRQDIAVFSTFKKAKDFVINYIKIPSYQERIKTIEFNKEGIWSYVIIGSWTPVYYLQRKEII